MSRKLIVLGVYGAYLALAAFLFLLGGKQLMLPAFPAALFAIVAWIGVWLIHSHKDYWRLASAPAAQLDEREIQARLNAYWTAYSLFVTLVFVGLVALSFGSDIMRIKTWDVNDVSALVWGVFLAGLTLSTAILMWTHETQTAEDEV